MTIYNFGSINLDHLYQVDHFVRPGETMASTQYQLLLGGKGANQSVALAKAGADIKHVGAINSANQDILMQLSELSVNTDLIAQVPEATGHAIIQLNKEAENAIILFQGANHALTEAQVDSVLAQASSDDWVLLQNETNLVAYTIEKAHELGIKVAFNPAPMDADLTRSVLACVDLLIVNEVEAMDLMQVTSIDDAKLSLANTYADLAILMTLGSDGVRYLNAGQDEFVPAFKVTAQDTTAAGDTFIGFCLAALTNNLTMTQAMQRGCAASAICVTRMGAAPAIPSVEEVDAFLQEHAK